MNLQEIREKLTTLFEKIDEKLDRMEATFRAATEEDDKKAA